MYEGAIPCYAESAATGTGRSVGFDSCWDSGRRGWGLSQAEIQVGGMTNSLQPHSMQIRISGEGETGGWLCVRGPLR
jgi:hypothetical protein